MTNLIDLYYNRKRDNLIKWLESKKKMIIDLNKPINSSSVGVLFDHIIEKIDKEIR